MDPFSCYEIGPLLFPHYFDTHLLNLGPLLVVSFKFSPLLSLLLPLLLTYFKLNLLLLLCSFATCLLLVQSFVDVPSPLLPIYFKFVCLVLSFVKFFIILALSLPTYLQPSSFACTSPPSLVQVWNLEHYSPLHFEVFGPIVIATFFSFFFLCVCVFMLFVCLVNLYACMHSQYLCLS